MGWETRRRGGRYYTRSKKINGRVVREYVGGGQLGELVAEMDIEDRLEQQARSERLRVERLRLDESDEALDAVCRNTDRLVAESLEAAGYHRHKGEWRKKRGRKDTSQQTGEAD